MKKIVLPLIVLVLVVAGVYLFTGTKDDSQPKIASLIESVTGGGQFSIEKSLLNRLPAEVGSLAFSYTDVTASGFKSYMDQWGEYSSSSLQLFQKSVANDPELQELANFFKERGVDLLDAGTWNSLLNKTLFFAYTVATQDSAGEDEVGVNLGAVAEVQDKSKAKNLLEASVEKIKTSQIKDFAVAVQNNVIPSADLSYSLNFEKEGGATTELSSIKVVAAIKGSHFAISGSEAEVERLLDSSGSEVPGILKTAKFKQATQELINQDKTYSLIYGDAGDILKNIQKIPGVAEELQKQGPEAQVALAALSGQTFPIKAIVSASRMEEAPIQTTRVVYDNSSPFMTWTEQVTMRGVGDSVKRVAGQPLLFVSVDLTSLGSVASAFALPNADTLLDVSSVSLVVAAAPAGQAVLPIPSVSILIKSANTEATEAILTESIPVGLASQGLGGGAPGAIQWKDEMIGGRKVSSLSPGVGVQVYLAKADEFVVVSNSRQQVERLFDNQANPEGFATGLSTRAKGDLLQKESLSTIYFDYVEFVSLLESMRGLMAMFGGQVDVGGQGINDFMAPEQLNLMKKLGQMILTLRHEPDKSSFTFENYYSPGQS